MSSSHVVEDSLRCEICRKGFTQKRYLELHYSSHRPVHERPFPCETCGLRFNRQCDLRLHLLAHSDEKPYACDYCNKRFLRKMSRTYHIAQNHTEDSAKRFLCELCGKRYVRNSELIKHNSKVHSQERLHQCEFCSQLFKAKTSLRYHYRVHTGEKPFKCHCCGSSFSTKKGFESHSARHSRNGPYVCSVCELSFITVGNAKKHIQYHIDTGNVDKENKSKPIEIIKNMAMLNRTNVLIQTNKITKPQSGINDETESNYASEFLLKNIVNIFSCDSCGELSATAVHTCCIKLASTCDVCKANFVQKTNPTKPFQVIDGDNYYLCEVCSEHIAFKQKMMLSF